MSCASQIIDSYHRMRKHKILDKADPAWKPYPSALSRDAAIRDLLDYLTPEQLQVALELREIFEIYFEGLFHRPFVATVGWDLRRGGATSIDVGEGRKVE